jgi:hypothetical protein
MISAEYLILYPQYPLPASPQPGDAKANPSLPAKMAFWAFSRFTSS